MRCLFQVALSDSPGTAEQLLSQICSLAQEAAEVDCHNLPTHPSIGIINSIKQTEQPYPAEELEWVATRAFNHAVDLYCSDDDEGCKNWAGQALNIAHFCADEGALEKLLQGKFAGLKLDGQVDSICILAMLIGHVADD